jgi:flagellar biosynthetic protein FlhB
MITDESIGTIMMSMLKVIAALSMPVAIAGFVAGVLGSVVQIGFNYSLKPIKPNLEKIDPIAGFWRVYSWNSLIEGFKSLLKLCVIGATAYYMVSDSFESSAALPELESQEMFNYLTSASFRLIGAIAIALFVISLLDVAYQKYRHFKQLMMTKQELRNEIKQKEGDPLLRARIRSVQREIAHRRMMEEVKKADVIVTNPTHIAVAIRYDLEKMSAPKVVAKGSDFIALNIKDLAKKHNVPVVENVPLARALHKSVKVGAYVPRALYQAVAEVLAFVYRLRGRIGRKK